MPRAGRYKEGIDFEWRDSGHGYRTRHFFTSAEKQARKGVASPKKPSPKKGRKPSPRKQRRATEEPATPLQSPPRIAESSIAAGDAELIREVREAIARTEGRGAGGPTTDRERYEAKVAKTRRRPFGMSKDASLSRWAYDRLEEEGTLGPEGPRVPKVSSRKRRKAPTRHPRSFNKGGLVKANCGASVKAKRGK